MYSGDQCPVGNILDRNGIKSVFVNQFKKGIPNGLFGAPNTQIVFSSGLFPEFRLDIRYPFSRARKVSVFVMIQC